MESVKDVSFRGNTHFNSTSVCVCVCAGLLSLAVRQAKSISSGLQGRLLEMPVLMMCAK